MSEKRTRKKPSEKPQPLGTELIEIEDDEELAALPLIPVLSPIEIETDLNPATPDELDDAFNRLSDRVLAGLNLYLAGLSLHKAAKQVDLTPTYLSKIKNSAEGQSYINAYRREISEWQKGVVVQAMKAISESLQSPRPDIRLRAADLVMKHLKSGDDKKSDTPDGNSASEIGKAIVQGFIAEAEKSKKPQIEDK